MNTIEKIKDYFSQPQLIDLYNIFSQLNMLLNSGLSLQKAIKEIIPYQENRLLKESLNSIHRSLSTGLSTGAAFRKEKVFPRIVSPSLEAGDRVGALNKTFLQLSEMFYLQHNLYSKVKNALLVPKISIVMISIMIIAYIKLAVPEFIKLYNETNLTIPIVLSLVSSIVNILVDYWYFTIIIIYLLWRLYKNFIANHIEFVDKIKLKLPIYKKLHYLFLQHQFGSTLSLMLESGLTTTEALLQSEKIVENIYMKNEIVKVRKDILNGMSLAASLSKNNSNNIFDKMLIAAINAGEKSANLNISLNALSKYYERTLNNMIEPVSTKITIIVLIPLGIIIVGLYLFTMVPLFSYMQQIA